MPVTKKQAAYRALERCGRLAIGQAPTSTLEDKANQGFDEVYAMLDDWGIVDWSEDEPIPDKYAFHVISLIAYAIMPELRVSGETKQRITEGAAIAEPALRELYNTGYTPKETYVTDY